MTPIDPILINDWHPVVSAVALGSEKPVAVRLLGEDLVVWRCASEFKVWSDLCIHRGAKLSLGTIRQDCLHCPYHGWTYGGDGACIAIPAHPGLTPPARAKARTFLAKEAYGWVWVCLSDTPTELPLFDEWAQPGYRTFTCGPFRVKALGPRLVENFLDLAHLPIVHHGILGDAAQPEINDYEVQSSPEGIVATGIEIWQPDPDGSGEAKLAHYTYRVNRPLSAYLTKVSGETRFSMMLSIAPESVDTSLAWIVIALQEIDQTPADTIVAWMETIFMQDVPIVESQRPERLPLDLQAELHLRSDRMSIAYRQWLARIGVTMGTA